MSLLTIHHLLNRTTWTIDTDTTAAMLSGVAPAWVSCHDCGTRDLTAGLFRNPDRRATCKACAGKGAVLIPADR